MAKHNRVGKVGEHVAARFLKNNGISIVGTNFSHRLGEIDIIAKSNSDLIFVEVKTVSCHVPDDIPEDGANEYRPEENVDFQKKKRLRRIIQIYLNKHKTTLPWRVDLLCVYLDLKRNQSRIKQLKNIII